MTKKVTKVVVYFDDGTYQELAAGISLVPFGIPDEVDPYIGKQYPPFVPEIPGEIGKWKWPGPDIGTTVVD